MFIGLNPSTADATTNDPTVRRCIGYAKSWNFGGVYIVNLFAYRCTQPQRMMQVPDPIGPHNDWYIRHFRSLSSMVVVAWGDAGGHLERNLHVLQLVDQTFCIKTNKSGEPAHPLYLRKGLLPILY